VTLSAQADRHDGVMTGFIGLTPGLGWVGLGVRVRCFGRVGFSWAELVRDLGHAQVQQGEVGLAWLQKKKGFWPAGHAEKRKTFLISIPFIVLQNSF
jgi:hypothetical protein